MKEGLKKRVGEKHVFNSKLRSIQIIRGTLIRGKNSDMKFLPILNYYDFIPSLWNQNFKCLKEQQ